MDALARESWNAIAPHLPTAGLVALAAAVEADDPELLAGGTVFPSAFTASGVTPGCACAVGYSGWKSEQLETTGDVWSFFYRVLNTVGTPMLPFVRWWDETVPRSRMLAEFAPVLAETLKARGVEVQKREGIACGL